MIFHVGDRVGALVDGQLSPAQADRLWAHVHVCSTCRSAVEREGWTKTRLAGLSFAPTPERRPAPPAPATYPTWVEPPAARPPRRFAGLAALGAGSAGAAIVGVLVLAPLPTEAPTNDRRAPVTNLFRPVETPVVHERNLRPWMRMAL
jgi:anti-sigma factor RsiW